MLAEWRPLMCPFDLSMSKAFERFKLFMPTILYEHEKGPRYTIEQFNTIQVQLTISILQFLTLILNGKKSLWMNEFLNLWTSLSTRHYWETHLTQLFSRVAHDTIGEFDWTPYIPYVCISKKKKRKIFHFFTLNYSLDFQQHIERIRSTVRLQGLISWHCQLNHASYVQKLSVTNNDLQF